jgi:uncharacterized repeat protein (TIGR01451 family)
MSRARTAGAALLLLVAPAAWAKPKMELSIQATKEVVQVVKGVRTTKRVPAESASPGEVMEYTLAYANRGDEAAREAVVDDPVPEGTRYVAGSATGAGADITFSVDGGKTFAKAEQLTVEVKLPGGKTEKRPASPDAYTHVRWTLKEVPAGTSGALAFRVQVK